MYETRWNVHNPLLRVSGCTEVATGYFFSSTNPTNSSG
jgi:hypothetical protein